MSRIGSWWCSGDPELKQMNTNRPHASAALASILVVGRAAMSAGKQNKSVEMPLVAKTDRRMNALKKKRKVAEDPSDTGNKKREDGIGRDEESDENKVAVGTALENYLILKEILSHLSPADLKRCCEVNETWRSIADQMIVCHDVFWSRDDLMVDEITRGHTNPQVETKTWRAEMTGEMTRLLEESRDPGPCIRLRVEKGNQILRERADEFFRTFGHRVFALSYKSGIWGDCVVEQDRVYCEQLEDFLKILTESVPNLEELVLPELRLEKRGKGNRHGFPPLIYLRKVDFGVEADLSQKSMVEILKVMPNFQEIDNFPVTMLKILRDANKFSALRSVQFCPSNSVKLDDSALQSLVDMGLGFRSLIVGKKRPNWSNLMYIQRNKARFESLLELGKDSLDHLVLPALEQIGFLKFPPKMTALKHISFRGKFSCKTTEMADNRRYFPLEFDLLRTFPNVNKVSVQDEESAILADLSFPRQTFGVEKLGDAVKILQVPSGLGEDVVDNLTKLFPHVQRVEHMEFYLEPTCPRRRRR